MVDHYEQSESDAPAWLAKLKRAGILALVAGVAIWIALIAANRLAKASARDYEAVGRVVWAHEVEGEWRGKRKPHLSGTRGLSRDGVGIVLDGSDETIEYARPRPSKLSELAPGDRVRVSYTEGGLSVWRHFRVRDVNKLAGSAP